MSDRILGLVVLVAGLSYAYVSTHIQTSFLTDPVGPKTFPIILGVTAALCGLLIALKPDTPGPTWPTPTTWLSLAVATGVLIGYAYSLKPLGFLIPTAIAAGILSFQIRPKAVYAAATGIGLAIGLYVIFRFLLGLSLAAVPRAWIS